LATSLFIIPNKPSLYLQLKHNKITHNETISTLIITSTNIKQSQRSS